MKKFISLLMVFGLALCLFGCQTTKEEKFSPVGEWKFEKVYFEDAIFLEQMGYESFDQLTDEEKEEYKRVKEYAENLLETMTDELAITIKFEKDGTCLLANDAYEDESLTCNYEYVDEKLTMTCDEAEKLLTFTYENGKLLNRDGGFTLEFGPTK